MAFALKKREPVAEGLRRVASSQLEGAAQGLMTASCNAELDDAVHDARVRLKRVRAVLALARDSMGAASRQESRRLKQIAGWLAGARDAVSMVEAFDGLCMRFGSLDPPTFDRVGRALRERADRGRSAGAAASAAQEREPPTATVLAAQAALLEAADRARKWEISGDGFGVIGPGLAATYSKVRQGRRDALLGDDAAVRHAWRVRVKRLADQFDLLRGVWPDVMKKHGKALRRIGVGLGDEHDLCLLAGLLRGQPEEFGDPEAVRAIARLAERSGREIVRSLRRPARRALAEKPGAFTRRLESLWRAWRGDG